MRQAYRSGFLAAIVALAWLSLAPGADAVEYRLRVVSIPESAYASFLERGESADGASGPGLDRLEAALDRGEFPKGPVLFDRRVQPVRESVSRAYGGARVLPDVTWGGEGAIVWDELVWQGTPGAWPLQTPAACSWSAPASSPSTTSRSSPSSWRTAVTRSSCPAFPPLASRARSSL